MKLSFRHTLSTLTFLLMVSTLVFSQKKENTTTKKDESLHARLIEAEANFTEGMKFYMMEDYEKTIAPFEKALEISPNNAGILYSIANSYQKLKDESKAISYVEKAIKLDSENPAYNELLADLLVRTKKYPEAIKTYQTLIQQYPTKTTYYIEQAAVYIFDNQYANAIKAYDRAERIMGVSEEITRQKQMIMMKIGKMDDAIKEGEKLVKSDPEDMDYSIEQAELLISNKQNEKAIPYLEKILQHNPENAQAHIMLAQLYQEKGDIEKCNKELEIALKDNNLDAGTKARILMSYINSAKDDKAKENAQSLVQAVIKSNPNDPKTHAILGDLLYQKEDVDGARDEYVKAARLDKSVNEVWGRIIQLDFDLRQIDSAITHSEEAIDVFPNQAAFWYLNGTAYYRKRQYTKAQESLEEARRLAPEGYEMTEHIHAQLGDTYNSLKKYTLSDQSYEMALKINPENDHVLNNYSYFLSLRKEKLERAAQMGSQLAERNPDNGTYLDTYAWVLYVMKNYEKAGQILEVAVKHNINQSGTIVEHYGDVLFQLGKKDKALEEWKKAKLIGSTSTLLDQKIREQKLIE